MKKEDTGSRPTKATPASSTAPATRRTRAPKATPAAQKTEPIVEVVAVAVPVEPVAPVAPASAVMAPAESSKKKKKAKVVRDSFTMPESDYAKIAELKKKSLEAGISIKKSELLRAGLHALEALPIAKLKALLGSVENVKTGRPAAEQSPADPKAKPAA